ncbi:MAG: aminoacyl-tRNA hydrolase [Bacilli bacterium]|nr:aminoacyl-tRNA hydrolase [Bacilli bacterium]
MKLIVGLGNPGVKYAKTRHNIGFMFIDMYAKMKKCDEYKEKFNGAYTTFMVDGEKIILLKPLTFMNLSGNAIKAYVDYFNIEHKDVLIIYDDKDLPFANLRLREKGNPGSHNGMKNITQMLQGNDYPRIRVGIGTPTNGMDMIDFVLSKFNEEEIKVLNDSFNSVASACDLFIKNNFNKAMNDYNSRKNA